ncbi:MAG: kelch repeat-containing protein, partial [archaeon]|nr:kelch repeat-containing protein [archaeon]
MNETWLLDLHLRAWTNVPEFGAVPEKRLSASSSVWRHFFVLFGGYKSSRMNDVYLLDLKSQQWKKPVIQGTPPCKRYGHCQVLVGSQLLIYGGSDGFCQRNDMWSFDLRSFRWQHLYQDLCRFGPDLPATLGDSYHSMVLADGKLHIFGSQSGNRHSTILSSVSLSQISQLDLVPADSFERLDSEINSKISDFATDSDQIQPLYQLLQEQYELLHERRRELEREHREKAEELERQRRAFSEELNSMATYEIGKHVRLNIGGIRFETTRTTLLASPSVLSIMFSGRYPLMNQEDGSVFIDRDGTHFRYILNYLRDQTCILPADAQARLELLAEASY